MEITQFPAQASNPSCETLHLTVTPGCYVTNLTPWPLGCQPEKTVAPSPGTQIQVSPGRAYLDIMTVRGQASYAMKEVATMGGAGEGRKPGGGGG